MRVAYACCFSLYILMLLHHFITMVTRGRSWEGLVQGRETRGQEQLHGYWHQGLQITDAGHIPVPFSNHSEEAKAEGD